MQADLLQAALEALLAAAGEGAAAAAPAALASLKGRLADAAAEAEAFARQQAADVERAKRSAAQAGLAPEDMEVRRVCVYAWGGRGRGGGSGGLTGGVRGLGGKGSYARLHCLLDQKPACPGRCCSLARMMAALVSSAQGKWRGLWDGAAAAAGGQQAPQGGRGWSGGRGGGDGQRRRWAGGGHQGRGLLCDALGRRSGSRCAASCQPTELSLLLFGLVHKLGPHWR
jgi:hypothetical protein